RSNGARDIAQIGGGLDKSHLISSINVGACNDFISLFARDDACVRVSKMGRQFQSRGSKRMEAIGHHGSHERM
ncbi:hypothetical protein L195_g051563, partial [Trifolium pratense]